MGTSYDDLRRRRPGENEPFYGFTECRGKPAGRGSRDSHATLNQVTAGLPRTVHLYGFYSGSRTESGDCHVAGAAVACGSEDLQNTIHA